MRLIRSQLISMKLGIFTVLTFFILNFYCKILRRRDCRNVERRSARMIFETRKRSQMKKFEIIEQIYSIF